MQPLLHGGVCTYIAWANPSPSFPGVSHRPPTQGRRPSGGGSPSRTEHHSSLASLLLDLNNSAISSISATINGTATLVDSGSDEEAFYRKQHLENNTFEADAPNPLLNHREGDQPGDGGREVFLAGDEVRVIVVKIADVRTSDWKGGVRDWVLVPEENAGGADANGV